MREARKHAGVGQYWALREYYQALSEEEVERLNIEEVKVRLSFRVGDTVQIVSGLFEGYTGVVQSISEDMRTVTVLVKRGRRDVPVEMETSLVRPAQ